MGPDAVPDPRADDHEARLDAAIAACHEAAESGAAPDLAAYIDQHSDLAPELRDYFQSAGMLDGLIDAATGEGPARIGPFRLIRVLGRGGMGVVHEVEEVSTGRRLALKRWVSSLDEPRARELFQREVEALARLEHPNIIPLLDSGVFEGLDYFVMPLIAGVSLRVVLHELRVRRDAAGGPLMPTTDATEFVVSLPEEGAEPIPLDPSRPAQHARAVARVGLQVARGLAHAHQRGVLHRDVKPSNLLLDPLGRVVLTDFGVARSEAHPDLTATDELAGALRFIAPERFRRWCDPRSDLYSLGLVLYELLTLERAHDAPDRAQLVQSILNEGPPKPRGVDRAIPRDLETIVLKCIEKEPGHRYASADDLAIDLERFLAGRPLLSRRVGPARRLWSWCRRHKARAAAVVFAVMMTVLLIAGAFRVQQLQAERAGMAARESRYRSTVLQLHQLRNGPRHDGWTGRGADLVREAVRLRGPDPEIQAEAVGLLQGLDTRAGPAWREGGARYLAFDPAGKRLVLGGVTDAQDRRKPLPTQVWALGAEGPVPTPVTAAGPVGFLADGTPIALGVAADGRHLELLELRQGKPLRVLDLPGPLATDAFEEPPLALAMTPDGSRVAAVVVPPNGERAIFVWDGLVGHASCVTGSFESLQDRPAATFPARCLAFSADGTLLAGGTEDGSVGVWSVADGALIASFTGDRTRIHALAFGAEPRRLRPDSPRPPGSGCLLAAATAGGNALVWDIAARARLATCRGSGFEVLAVAFSPDSTLLATAGRTLSGLRIWEARTGTLLLETRAGGEFATALAFSPDGRTLAAANRGGFDTTGAVVNWTLQEGRGLLTLRGPESRIIQVAVSPDSRFAAALANDWTAAIWDAATGRLLHLLEVPHGFSPDNAGLAFSPDGRRFAFASGREAVLWDLNAGRELNVWPLPPGLNDALAFHGEKELRLLRTETRDNAEPFGPNRPTDHPRVLRLRDLLRAESLTPIRESEDLPWMMVGIQAAADGRCFVVQTQDNANDNRGRLLVLDGATGAVCGERSNPTTFYALDAAGMSLVVNTDGGKSLLRLPTLEPRGRVAGAFLALGPGAEIGLEPRQRSASGAMRFGLVDARRGERFGWVPADNFVETSRQLIAFAPGGRFAVWGCGDGTATLCGIDAVLDRMERYTEGSREDDGRSSDAGRTFWDFFAPLRFISPATAFLILGVMVLAHDIGAELRAARDAWRASRSLASSPDTALSR